jgi:DNA-binding XRE family transcriptional regulator
MIKFNSISIEFMKKVTPSPIPSTDSPCEPASLGLFIKAARTQQGLTIEQAAALTGVSLGTFVAAENKTATLKLATVFKILNSLGIQLRARLQNTPTGGNDGWF